MELGVYRFYEYILVPSKTHTWYVYIINYSKLLIERKKLQAEYFQLRFLINFTEDVVIINEF